MSRSVFAPDAVDPETLAFNARLERALAAAPPLHRQAPAELRAAREAWPPIELDPNARAHEIEGPGGALGLRILPAREPRGVYLHLHGGGWVLGRAHHQDPTLAAIARDCQLTVVSVDYRLAPEHPHPAACDDALAAALWVIRDGPRELGSGRLAIGGESAGAHLAVVTLVRLRDRHGYSDCHAAILNYGTFDLRLTPSARAWGTRPGLLDEPTLRWFIGLFVPPDRLEDSEVSPLLADLRSMPRALFSVGTRDPVLDDSLFLHARWLATGAQAELAAYPGGVHGFLELPHPLAARAQARIRAFLLA